MFVYGGNRRHSPKENRAEKHVAENRVSEKRNTHEIGGHESRKVVRVHPAHEPHAEIRDEEKND